MSDIAIQVENLSKQYRIGTKEIQHDTLMSAAVAWVKSPLENFRQLRRLSSFKNGDEADVLWALRDVSFTVKHGEVLGIIGRNGAGKSTLLKILSRITPPSSGRIMLNGRVASLLEVGTGFHPELTGRENIYLNGTILGMTRTEVEHKFDEIMNFSGVERFIDTPVKRYSSGMKVRLAFAVAAHLEPEILLVDEVLAVGDAEFQKKCLGKMSEVAQTGRTVIFVSHNMAAVNQLCERGIVLVDGELRFEGSTEQAIEKYLRDDSAIQSATIDTSQLTGRSGTGDGRILEVRLSDESGNPSTQFGIGDALTVELRGVVYEPIHRLSMGVEITTLEGLGLLNLRTDSQGIDFGPYRANDEIRFQIKVPSLPFYPNTYLVRPWIAERGGKRIDYVQEGITLTLEAKGNYLSERMIQAGRGLVILDAHWLEKPHSVS
ncbi:MAG: ABC transporter ATP-binding protein [Anaerolineae bacterium]|nr:ABC transporter ATP-binding protein [Anaerolineae bacterium]